MAEVTQFYRGALTVSEVMATKPASVPRGTTLLEAANILTRNRYRYVLVINNDGRLAGVISNSDLLQQVAESAETDAETWKSKTVDSVMNTKFVASSPDADPEDITPLIATSSLECIPVLEGDRLLGVLTRDDLLVSWSRVDPTLREATIDTVTHLPNRAIFNRRLEEEWERARRQSSSLSVILVDIDYFKEINDACGHLTGDAVLHMIGSCLARHLRMYDVLARFGGDEFAAICYDCDSENIDVPISRLQRAVRNLSVPSNFGRRSLTLSVGAATVYRGLDSWNQDDLVAAADACLYRAKTAGRDCAYRTELGSRDEPGGRLDMLRIGEPQVVAS